MPDLDSVRTIECEGYQKFTKKQQIKSQIGTPSTIAAGSWDPKTFAKSKKTKLPFIH